MTIVVGVGGCAVDRIWVVVVFYEIAALRSQ